MYQKKNTVSCYKLGNLICTQLGILILAFISYQLGRIQEVKVNHYSLVSIDGNYYSVPDKMVGKTAIAIIYVSFIVFYDQNNHVLCKHTKKDGKGNYAMNILHYIDTFLQKPSALRNSLALKQAPAVLQSIFNQYFTTDPKLFLHYLLETDCFDALDELTMHYGFIRKRPIIRVDSKYLGFESSSIEEISKRQLEQTAQLFNQKGDPS